MLFVFHANVYICTQSKSSAYIKAAFYSLFHTRRKPENASYVPGRTLTPSIVPVAKYRQRGQRVLYRIRQQLTCLYAGSYIHKEYDLRGGRHILSIYFGIWNSNLPPPFPPGLTGVPLINFLYISGKIGFSNRL